ncbi:MAG: MFS transporter, partial [Alphaproteobacteria bacterium]
MQGQRVAISSLLLGTGFLLLANGLNGVLLPIRGTIEGFTTTQLALLGTAWALGFISATLLVPTVVRRVGHVRGYGALASLAAVAILLCSMMITPAAWIALRVLTGFCFAGAAMIVESWLNERATADNRGRLFSVYQMVHFTASTAGQFMIALRAPTDFLFFALAAIFYCLAILPTALSTARSPAPLRKTRLEIPSLYRNSPISAVGCVLIGMANGSFGTLAPVYALQIGLPVRDIAMLLAGALLGGALVQYPLGWLSDRVDRRRVLLAIAVGGMAIGLAFTVLQPRTTVFVVSLAAVYGMLVYPMYALTVAHANDFAEPDNFVGIATGLLLLYGLGTAIGPVLSAQLMDSWRPEALFAFTALVHGLLAAYAAFRIT